MAIIKAMLGEKVISGFRGVLDFYFWKGIPCVRKWPRKIGPNRTDAVLKTASIFTQAAKLFPSISPIILSALEDMVVTTNLTSKDMFFRGYISGTLRYFYSVDELPED